VNLGLGADTDKRRAGACALTETFAAAEEKVTADIFSDC